jgi:hypothetical protein
MTRQQMVVVCVCGVALCMMMLASTHTEERETSLSRTVLESRGYVALQS